MRRRFKMYSLLLVILVFTLACSLPLPFKSAGEATVESTAVVKPTQTPRPTKEPTEAEPTTTPTVTPIVHLTKPDFSPPGKAQVIHDQESILKADEHQAYGGDEFLIGRYERPFDQEMEYIPSIDIVQANLFRDEENDFVYTIIRLEEDPAMYPDLTFHFGIELDVGVDGRGDIFILSEMPASDVWSVEGVSVWKDLNKDNGGMTPMQSDPPAGGDGYEVKIFDSGDGYDPDLAWSRISVEDPKFIEIAFKKDLLDETGMFLWGAWSYLGSEQLGLFDYHDHYTFEEAGSPMKSETEYYPLRDLYAMDNTCRAASGFTPLGGETGLCPAPAPAPGEPEQGGRNCRLVCSGAASVAMTCSLVCD